MVKRIAIAILVMFMVFVTSTEAQEFDERDRFALWNNCRPVDLQVEDLPKDAVEMGLTKEVITNIVRSRLRQAQIYSSDDTLPHYLYVNVHVVGQAFSIDIHYGKMVEDPVSGMRGLATTWDTAGAGQHGGESTYIRSWISNYTDEFIDEYLDVNESACH